MVNAERCRHRPRLHHGQPADAVRAGVRRRGRDRRRWRLSDLFLRPGTYDLELSDTDARYRETTVTVTVTPTTVTLAPITMALVPTWTYSGKVVDGAGTGIPGARVRLHQLIGQAGDFWDYTTGPVVSADSTGKYTFTNLTDGQFYTVGASAYRHATSVLGGGTDPTEGTAFRATQNRPTLPNLTLADATGLTGSVSSAFGPSEGVTVELIRWVRGVGRLHGRGRRDDRLHRHVPVRRAGPRHVRRAHRRRRRRTAAEVDLAGWRR